VTKGSGAVPVVSPRHIPARQDKVHSSSRSAQDTRALPTGFAILDRALGIGGLPCSRITEIFGPANCGKTALALQAIAHGQRTGTAAAWIDAEHAFDPTFASKLGVDLERMPVAEPASAEEALEMTRRLAASGAIDLVVVDSAAALVPQIELETGLAAASASLQGRVLGSELRRLLSVVRRSGVAILFLNQTRTRLEASAGELETSAGGPSLKLYAAVRIALAATGKVVRFRVLKNELAAPFTTGELEWRRGSGFVEGP
jgi:recombination protein RecA